MRDFYLSYLTTFGLGAAIAFSPSLSVRADQPDTPEPNPPATSSTMAGFTANRSPNLSNQPSVSASSSTASALVGFREGNQPQPIFSSAQAQALKSPAAVEVPLSGSQLAQLEEASEEAEDTSPAPEAAPVDAIEDNEAEAGDPADTESPGLSVPEAQQPLAEPASDPEPASDSPDSDTLPAAEQPRELTEDEIPDPPPEYLQPAANPLLTPTQPEEVEILDTQPLSLETAIELAYRNNQELQIALLEVERSQAALREAQAALYPTLNANAALQANNSASPVDSRDAIPGLPGSGSSDTTTTSANAGLELNYDLGISGRRSAQIRAAEESLRNAELELERVQAQLRLDTINDYYTVQDATAQIAINQAFLDEAERNLNDTVLREEVGVGTRFDVLRSQVQVANARQSVISAQSQRRTAQRQLAARLNLPPSINVDTLPVEIAGSWPLSLEESIVLAYQGRAELEQLLVQRQISEAQRQVALSAVRPELGLFANYNVVQGFSSGFSEFDDGFTIGAQLQWRLFDGGAAAAAAEQSERDIEIAESNFASTRNDIRLQVEQAYFELEANRENIDTAELAVQQAEEAVELANLRFNAGVGTQLDVLTATSELADARGNLVTAILDYNRALAALERAVSNLDLPQPVSSRGELQGDP